jgi:hypothetical protein
LGYIYWRTKSVLNTIAIHGLNNFFVTGIFPMLTGISAYQVVFKQSTFKLIWLIGQVGVTLLLSHYLFNEEEQSLTWKNLLFVSGNQNLPKQKPDSE